MIQLNNFAQQIDFKFEDNIVAKKLFNIIISKRTNLAVAADVTTKSELLKLADDVGPEICFLKTHMDIIKDFDWDLILQLKKLSIKHNFLIVEDRKFADIGSTVYEQYTGGIYKIGEWADIVIAHAISGPGIIKALEQASIKYKAVDPYCSRALLLIAQLSSEDNLIDENYTQQVIKFAQENKNFVVGFIAQKTLTEGTKFITCTPGVSINQTKDNLGQNYNSPEYVIKTKKSDVIIVGRGIYASKDPQSAAQEYRELAWKAYQESGKTK